MLAAALWACGPVKPMTADAGDGSGITHETGIANPHVPSCEDPAQCGDGSEPPIGGPHCPVWTNCRVWDMAQPRCEYIHNLEHGHMVLAYNCPSGCADVVSALTAYWMGRPDPKRILVTPEPLLKSKVAAMVWGWGWAGDSVDTSKLDEIASHQDKEAPEAGLPCDP
jgi:hypothetical protein